MRKLKSHNSSNANVCSFSQFYNNVMALMSKKPQQCVSNVLEAMKVINQ